MSERTRDPARRGACARTGARPPDHRAGAAAASRTVPPKRQGRGHRRRRLRSAVLVAVGAGGAWWWLPGQARPTSTPPVGAAPAEPVHRVAAQPPGRRPHRRLRRARAAHAAPNRCSRWPTAPRRASRSSATPRKAEVAIGKDKLGFDVRSNAKASSTSTCCPAAARCSCCSRTCSTSTTRSPPARRSRCRAPPGRWTRAARPAPTSSRCSSASTSATSAPPGMQNDGVFPQFPLPALAALEAARGSGPPPLAGKPVCAVRRAVQRRLWRRRFSESSRSNRPCRERPARPRPTDQEFSMNKLSPSPTFGSPAVGASPPLARGARSPPAARCRGPAPRRHRRRLGQRTCGRAPRPPRTAPAGTRARPPLAPGRRRRQRRRPVAHLLDPAGHLHLGRLRDGAGLGPRRFLRELARLPRQLQGADRPRHRVEAGLRSRRAASTTRTTPPSAASSSASSRPTRSATTTAGPTAWSPATSSPRSRAAARYAPPFIYPVYGQPEDMLFARRAQAAGRQRHGGRTRRGPQRGGAERPEHARHGRAGPLCARPLGHHARHARPQGAPAHRRQAPACPTTRARRSRRKRRAERAGAGLREQRHRAVRDADPGLGPHPAARRRGGPRRLRRAERPALPADAGAGQPGQARSSRGRSRAAARSNSQLDDGDDERTAPTTPRRDPHARLHAARGRSTAARSWCRVAARPGRRPAPASRTRATCSSRKSPAHRRRAGRCLRRAAVGGPLDRGRPAQPRRWATRSSSRRARPAPARRCSG